MSITAGESAVAESGLGVEEVLARIDWLKTIHDPQLTPRTRVRQILDGGADGIKALLGDAVAEVNDMVPIPPLLQTGLKRLGQKIGGAVPDLRVDPQGYKDSERAKLHAEKRERIVHSYDQACRLELQLPQVGRWLPGYGYVMWVIRDKRRGDVRWPHAELRDPYTVFPGPWNMDQQPAEVAVVQKVPLRELFRLYPDHRGVIEAAILQKRPRTKGGAILLTQPSGQSWGNQADDGYEVGEYWNSRGTWITLPELGLSLDFVPNPLWPEQRYVIAKRFAFNRLVGHYDHLIGLMSTMARIQILEYIHLEDNVFAPTNIFGQSLEGDVYRQGRNAVNRFEAGTNARVERPTTNLPYQLFQGIDRIERELRYGASYPVTDDAQSPSSWTTGQGLTALRQDVDLEVKEYRTILKYAVQDLDARRLAWDEARNSGHRRTIGGFRRDASYTESYDPSEIGGRYETRRVFGVMAGWDEPSKIVAGLQLYQAEAIDMQTFQENLDGLEGISKVNERIRGRKAEETAWGMLQQAAAQPNPMDPTEMPRARLAIVEILGDPAKFTEVLTKFYTEKPPEPSPEEMGMMGQQMPGMEMPPDGDITTILSRLEGTGPAAGGVQTVGRV